ncbi:hypothetical protein D7V91_08640 [bacterium 1xD42-67]|nr:hypothetical protein D7V91_08640 [bacterium 1xD42-67]
MIWEELQTIKSFSSSLESDVTIEDIEEKERELGVKIPAALRGSYLTFNEADPVFSASDEKIFPLRELAVYHSEGLTLVPFLSSSLGGKEICQLGFTPDLGPEDDPYYVQYHVQKFGGRDCLCIDYKNKIHLSSCLLFHFGKNLYQSKPDGIFTASFAVSAHEPEESIKTASQRFKLILGAYPDRFAMTFGLMGYNEELSLWMKSSVYGTHITILDPGAVDDYMRRLGITDYRWDRRGGEPVVQRADRPPIKKRPLHSLQPILDLVCEFLGAEKQGISQAEMEEAGQRFGISLPTPLLECYLQAPPQLRTGPDRFLAPDELRADEDQKIRFLVGDQGVPKYAFESGSPIVCRYDEQEQTWNEHALIDGFLAAELFWNAMGQEHLGVVLAELSQCTGRTFGAKGRLGRSLSPVGKELTRGCPRSLYASPDHKILALYDGERKTACLASVGEGPLKQLEEDAGIELSWLV